MNKFSFLLAALCVSLHAQEAKPADTKAAAPAPDVKLTGSGSNEPKSYQIEILNLKNVGEIDLFQRYIQLIKSQDEELRRQQFLLENALTTPEREARGHQIAASQAKQKGDKEQMAKIFGAFVIDRNLVVIPIKAIVATPLSNEQLAKLAAEKDNKKDNVLTAGDKKFLIRNTIAGQPEVEALFGTHKLITELKGRLQYLIEIQPKLTKEDEKSQAEKSIKETQELLGKKLEEFKKAYEIEYSSELVLTYSEIKIAGVFSEEEKKALEAKAPTTPQAAAPSNAPAPEKK